MMNRTFIAGVLSSVRSSPPTVASASRVRHHLPESRSPGSTRLWTQVVHQWPSFAAYAVSFYVIGVIWVTHPGLFALITRVDRVLLFENLLLLMFVVAMPFTTATLADFIQSPHPADARAAVLLYGLSDIGMAFSFTAMFSRVAPPPDPAAERQDGQPG
jgi:uncharacterized membrane protein